MYLDDRITLSPGTEIPGGQETYIIDAFLGLGLTAQVYRARGQTTGRVVALKVLRHDASNLSTEHFWHEAQVLNELRGVLAVPELYESYHSEGAEYQFLALEYVAGRPLSDSLDPLPEQEALEVARQALTLLQVLHEQVGRTYTDMQLKNFIWNAETHTLKVLDWNHVSTQRDYIPPDELQFFGVISFEQLAQRDLARFGAYFYRILTGKGAFEQGEPAFALERRAGDRWDRISVAVRQIVRCALHPDPTRRYASATDFLRDVIDLQSRWQAPVDEKEESEAIENLMAEAKEARNVVREVKEVLPEHRRALELLDEASARIDLLERRGHFLEGYLRRLNTFTQGVSAAWGSGKLYYEGEQFEQAKEIWEAEAKAEGRADLWRWVLLTEAGASNREGFTLIREKIEEVVKDLEKQEFEKAAQAWNALVLANPWIAQNDVPVHWFGVELQAVQQTLEGRSVEIEGDAAQDLEAWERAQQAFAGAHAAMQSIPYGLLLSETDDMWQGLETKAQQLQKKIAGYREVSAQAQELSNFLESLTDMDGKHGLAKLQLLLNGAQGTPEILNLCKAKVQEWQEHNPELALGLVDAVLSYGQAAERDVWLDLRQKLRAALKIREDGERRLKGLSAALEQQAWVDLQKAAMDLPTTARALTEYDGILTKLREAYRERFTVRDLKASEALNSALTALEGFSEQRQQKLQELQRDLWQEKAEQIKAALENNAWEEAKAQVRSALVELPDAMHSEPLHTELGNSVQAIYQDKVDWRLLEDAAQAHQILEFLGVGDAAARSRELAITKGLWEDQVAALRAGQSTLVQQTREEEQRRLKAEAAAQQAERRHQRLDQLTTRTSGFKARWKELLKGGDESVHRTVLGEVNCELARCDSDDKELSGEPLYTDWSDYLKRLQNYLEEQLKLIAVSKRRLDEAGSRFEQARKEAAKFSKGSLDEAQRLQRQAHVQLAYKPPEQDKKRHDDWVFYVLELGQILRIMEENNIVDAVQATQCHIQQYREQLDQHKPEAELLLTLASLNRAWEGVVRKGIWDGISQKGLESGDLWDRVKKNYFPQLALLEQQVYDWNKLDFFSGGGQGISPVVLLPSLKESMDALLPSLKKDREDVVNAALTTFHEAISGYLDRHFEEVNSGLKSLRSRLAPAWVQWVSLATAIALAILLLFSFWQFGALRENLVALGDRSQQVESGIQRLEKQTSTMSGRLENLERLLTPPPMLTATPTPTITPMPTVTPPPEETPSTSPSSVRAIAWTRGITMYTVPPLTLTVEPGWAFVTLMRQEEADSESTAAYTEVVALDAAQTVWHIAVALRDVQSRVIPLTGTLVVSDEQKVLWRPQSFAPFAGEYHVEVQLSREEDQQSVQSDPLVIAPLYGVSHARLRVYDPGSPGMSVIYRITNTGNITDTFGLALYNEKTNVPLTEISGVITLTNGITQALASPIAEPRTGLLTFVSPVPDSPALQSYSVLLPALGPGQAMDINLMVRVASGCPAVIVEIVSQAGTGTPYEIEETFGNCR